jgi:hypothetical protein
MSPDDEYNQEQFAHVLNLLAPIYERFAMPASKVSCPKCRVVLKPSKPLTVGKKVKCPKCANLFTVRPDDSDVQVAVPTVPKGKTNPKPAAPVKAKKPAYDDDDEDGPAVYSFADAQEDNPEAEEKDDISVVPDLAVKDPRGPATERLIKPSNWLIRLALIGCLTNVCLGFFYLIPQLLPVEDEATDAKSGNSQSAQAKADKEKKAKESDKETLGLTRASFVFLMFGLLSFSFAYYALIVIGVFKMQTLESYKWSIAACIMAFLPLAAIVPPLVVWAIEDYALEDTRLFILPYLTGGNWLSVLLAGIFTLVALRSKEVIAGFNYQSD